MAKMIDFATATRPIVPATQEEVRADLKSRYLDNGWTLFATHYMGVVGPEVMMAYVFVKYADDVLVAAASQVAQEHNESISSAPRKRGRPAKVVEPVAEG